MFQSVRRQSRTLLVLSAITAIALSGCSGSGGTSAPGGANGSAASNAPGGGAVASNAPGGGGGGAGALTGAAAAFATINSYKFSMTLAGGPYSSMLSMFGGAGASGGAAFSIGGTVTVKPEKASDVKILTMHMISVGGFDYTDLGMGGFSKSPSSGTSVGDSLSPSLMFSSFGSMSDYSKVGSGNKNGLDADHYQANSSAFAAMGPSLQVPADATWTGDIWIAKNGGYPVSAAILAKTSGGTVSFQMTYDITNVNDASNKVSVPTNVLP